MEKYKRAICFLKNKNTVKYSNLSKEELDSVMKLRRNLNVVFIPFYRDFLLEVIPEKTISEIEKKDKVNRYALGCELASVGNSFSENGRMIYDKKVIKGFHSTDVNLQKIIKNFHCDDAVYSLSIEKTFPVKEDDFYYAGGQQLAQGMMYFCATRFLRSFDYDRLFFLAVDMADSSVENEFNLELCHFQKALKNNQLDNAKEHLQNARAIMVVRNTAIDNWNKYYAKSLLKNLIYNNLIEFLTPIDEGYYYYTHGVLSLEEKEIFETYMEIEDDIIDFCNSTALEAYQYLICKNKENFVKLLSLDTKEIKDFIKEINSQIFNLNWRISSVHSEIS